MKEQPLIGQILSPVETTRYRALAATANFLSIDRGDIVYNAKELTHHMATPTTTVVRLGRYLKIKPRVQLWYKFQETPCQLETFSDTDWAGCRRTRCSSTGGYIVAGSHLTKMWCKTKAAVHRKPNCSIVARRGLGKLRHLNTNYFWIQEKAAKGDLNFKKVAGVDNGADLFTKTLSWNEIQSHIHKLSSQFVQNEINVNYVGARPNGVNLPRILQEMGLAGDRKLAAWTRTDMTSRTRRTTMKGGLVCME